MTIRPYQETDADACKRVWHECGWTDGDAIPDYVRGGRGIVAELSGEAECLALAHDATLLHLDDELSLCAVTGVTTSRVARRQGVASRTTARLVAEDAAAGRETAALGIFDQGFYNRLGFGNGAYRLRWSIDPGALRVPIRHRPPLRFDLLKDSEALLACRLNRRRGHGAVSMLAPEHFQAAAGFLKHHFVLGYRGEDGAISHAMCCDGQDRERGPYTVHWIAWQTREELLELLSVLASFADQVYGLTIDEQAGVQLQDLLDQPFRRKDVAGGGRFAVKCAAHAEWQLRILDLPACLAKTHLPGEPVRFNLELEDPIAAYLDDDASWHGLTGVWQVQLGPESFAERGENAAWPTLWASVGAFRWGSSRRPGWRSPTGCPGRMSCCRNSIGSGGRCLRHGPTGSSRAV